MLIRMVYKQLPIGCAMVATTWCKLGCNEQQLGCLLIVQYVCPYPQHSRM